MYASARASDACARFHVVFVRYFVFFFFFHVQGMVNTLDELKARKLPFAIATTSPKPRVPASVHACGLDDYFPADKIHSGESDFDPPRFKPDPSVYLRVSQSAVSFEK